MLAVEHDWPRLGKAVRQRRDALGLSQGAGGVSVATWRKVENGTESSYTPRTLARIASALGWTDDSVDAVLAGGDPTIAADPPSAGDVDLLAIIADLQSRVDALEERIGIGRDLDRVELEERATRRRVSRSAAADL